MPMQNARLHKARAAENKTSQHPRPSNRNEKKKKKQKGFCRKTQNAKRKLEDIQFDADGPKIPKTKSLAFQMRTCQRNPMKISAKRFPNFSSQFLYPSAIFLPTAWHLCTTDFVPWHPNPFGRCNLYHVAVKPLVRIY